MKEKIQEFECLCCHYKWNSRYKNINFYPGVCPSCKAKCWDFGLNLKCHICKRTSLTPIIHHIDGNHKKNSKKNRIAICMDCHTAIHCGIGFEDIKKRGRGRTKRRTYNSHWNKKLKTNFNDIKSKIREYQNESSYKKM